MTEIEIGKYDIIVCPECRSSTGTLKDNFEGKLKSTKFEIKCTHCHTIIMVRYRKSVRHFVSTRIIERGTNNSVLEVGK